MKEKLYSQEEVNRLLIEARIDQSKITSNWIEQHIKMLHKDPAFKEVGSSVALTYAEDQARQGRYKALNHRKER